MVPFCSNGTLTNVQPHKVVMPQTQDMTPHPHHSIQTQGRPVIVLSINVECNTGIDNYPFQCLGSDPIGKSFPDLPHAPANAKLDDAVMVVVRQKIGRKFSLGSHINFGLTTNNGEYKDILLCEKLALNYLL